jgi:hypothetical protein
MLYLNLYLIMGAQFQYVTPCSDFSTEYLLSNLVLNNQKILRLLRPGKKKTIKKKEKLVETQRLVGGAHETCHILGMAWEVEDGIGERSDCRHARLGTIGLGAPNWPPFLSNQTRRRTRVPFQGAGVNKVYVRKTPLAIPHGSGVGCNTTSPFAGSRHCINT